MQLLQFIDPMYGRCVGRIDGSDVVDITSTQRDVRTIYDICYRHGGCDIGLAEAVRSIEDTGSPPRRLPVDELLSNEDPARPRIHQPIDPSPAAPTALRIWLAGVTHADSTRLREIEARQATGRPVNVYDQEIRGVRAGRPSGVVPETRSRISRWPRISDRSADRHAATRSRSGTRLGVRAGNGGEDRPPRVHGGERRHRQRDGSDEPAQSSAGKELERWVW